MNPNLRNVIANFDIKEEVLLVEPYGDGHINDTYLVHTKGDNNYILQRINTHVFKDVDVLMNNIVLVTKHLHAKNNDSGLEVILTKDGNTYVEHNGEYFRVYNSLEETVSYTFIEDKNLLYEAGISFGKFQKDLFDFDVSKLHETIPDFHNTKTRYEFFKESLRNADPKRKKKASKEIDFILNHEDTATTLVTLLEEEKIPKWVTHNDTKINNILFCSKTNKGAFVIDLDTVMPGSTLYDYGDAIRFTISNLEEDDPKVHNMTLRYDYFESYTKGYLKEVGPLLNPYEKKHLVDSAIIITLELASRFLADYLNGDIYFKTKYDTHNLHRAKNQLKIVELIQKNKLKLEKMVVGILNEVLEIEKVHEELEQTTTQPSYNL